MLLQSNDNLCDDHRLLQRVTDHKYLALIDSADHCGIYIEDIGMLSRAIRKERLKKKIYFAKFVESFVVAFDQSLRMLAICGSPPVSDIICMNLCRFLLQLSCRMLHQTYNFKSMSSKTTFPD